MAAQEPVRGGLDISVAHLQEADLAEADHISRLAFGTFIGLPDPASFHQGADYVFFRSVN